MIFEGRNEKEERMTDVGKVEEYEKDSTVKMQNACFFLQTMHPLLTYCQCF